MVLPLWASEIWVFGLLSSRASGGKGIGPTGSRRSKDVILCVSMPGVTS
jgi:hypothetical protein